MYTQLRHHLTRLRDDWLVRLIQTSTSPHDVHRLSQLKAYKLAVTEILALLQCSDEQFTALLETIILQWQAEGFERLGYSVELIWTEADIQACEQAVRLLYECAAQLVTILDEARCLDRETISDGETNRHRRSADLYQQIEKLLGVRYLLGLEHRHALKAMEAKAAMFKAISSCEDFGELFSLAHRKPERQTG